MIDIHCHILPHIDDGPKSVEESLRLARQAVEDGIRVVVATPHALNGVYTNTRADVLAALSAFAAALSEHGIDLELVAGSDAHLSTGMAARVRAGEVCTVGDRGRHLLLELPEHVLPEVVKNEIFSLMVDGITPVITHPERNASIRRDPDLLYDLIRMGALSQVTAMSLTGGFGRSIEKTAGEFLARRLVHVIATDAHSPDRRPALLSAAVAVAAGIIGSRAEAERMVTTTPAAIVAGDTPDIPDPLGPELARGFFSRLFG